MDNDTIKMLGRYALSGAFMYAASKGWLSQMAADAWVKFSLDALTFALAAVPPLYAAIKINNAPKP